ncbi:hypothetical protein BD769DRAFT_1435132 [Suillus cothurnatus]|nr:hypothetical protein BD769DRAFT_1435132 [Suillus cothurnatus]
MLIGIAIIFGVVWAILFAQVWWTCELNPSWKKLPRPQCPLGRDVAVAQIVTITTAVSLTHAYYVFTVGGLQEAVSAMFEASISLIVANLSVVVTFFLRMLTEDETISQPTMESGATTMRFEEQCTETREIED